MQLSRTNKNKVSQKNFTFNGIQKLLLTTNSILLAQQNVDASKIFTAASPAAGQQDKYLPGCFHQQPEFRTGIRHRLFITKGQTGDQNLREQHCYIAVRRLRIPRHDTNPKIL